MSEIECPYCGQEQDINHDDGFGYEEGVNHQMECCNCGKTFIFQSEITYYYQAYKADCLNGEPHDWQMTNTHPKSFTKMRCSMCDEERSLTPEELELLTLE